MGMQATEESVQQQGIHLQALVSHEHDDEEILSWNKSCFYSVAINPSVRTQKFEVDQIPLPIDEMSYMVHCDGMLLCVTKTDRLGVMNPCLCQFRWIEGTDFMTGLEFFGFGYDNQKRHDGYKIVRFNDSSDEPIYGGSDSESDVSVKIFEFKTNTWRVLDVDIDWTVESPSRGVSLKGKCYWIAYWNGLEEYFIQSFDFSSETFKHLCDFPFEFCPINVLLLSAFREDQLSVFHQCIETSKINIWVTNKIGSDEGVEWRNFMTVASPNTPLFQLDHGYNYSYPCFFVDKNDKLIVCCDVEYGDEEQEEIRKREEVIGELPVSQRVYVIAGDEIYHVEIGQRSERNDFPFILGYVYVPSVVPVHHRQEREQNVESQGLKKRKRSSSFV